MRKGFRLIGGLVIALAALTQYTSAQAPPINARTIEDRDHVTVMELTGGYDRQPEASRAYEENIRKAIARELLRQHQDDYDFIVSFSNFPFNLGSDEEGTRVGGRYYAIKNDVQGIGQAQFDHSADWGSAGRLQGYIDMGNLGSLVTDPTDPRFETTLSTLSHEVAHRWSAHLRFQNPDGTPNTSLLGRDSAHWSFFLQSHNSVLYGNDWRDNGNGTFTSVGRSRSYYSPLDLYAMGVIDRSEVPPFFLIENAEGDPSRLPEVGATVNGSARTITIDDVIAAEGERVPEAGSSPRQFKIAFVYLVRPGEVANGAQLRAINNIREAFATRMVILTGGRALIEIFPDATEPGVTDPGRLLPPSSGPRTAAVDLAQGFNWLLSRQAVNGRFADSASTAVRDTAAAIDLLAGQPATFASRQAALGWLSALQDASNVDTVSRRVAAIAPQFSPADNTFLLGARHASGGWGLRAGDETDPFDTALALAAIQGGDPSAAMASLIATQLPDGSWPLNLGGPGSILATSTVLRLAGRFASAPFNEALTRGATWLETRQNSDGGFGESGSTAYETALAIVHASRVASTTVDVRWAVEYLRRGQLADGSWNESVYETALAVLALQLGDLPNVALVASSLAFAPADPVEGEVVTLTALLANTGSTDLTNVAVRVYDGHPSSGGLPIGEEVIVASLPSQAQVPIALSWNTTDAAGNHEIVAIADPSLILNESNEADNVLTGPLAIRPPPEGPDLAIANADLVFTPDSLGSVPQTQAFDARIANLGRTAAPNVQVALFAGDPAAGGARVADTVIDVAARGSSQVTFNVTITTPGERRYFIVADPDNTLNEADEANNVASRTLAVTSAIDLFVTPGSITFSENPIALGRDLQIGAQVGNSGTADVFAARVRVFIDAPGGAIEVATLTHDLPAGQTRTISATWRTSRTLADAPVIVQVDPLSAFSETSETNNQASAALSVPSSTDANLRVTHQELGVVTPVLQGGSTTLQIPVRNTGFADAANVGVAFYAGLPGSGGVQIGATQTIDLIPAGGQANASVVWDQITTFGDKLIYAVVDPAGTVTEFDEQDNSAFITVDVLSLPDLAVSSASLSFSPAFPRNGEPVTVSALVSNLGEQTAGNVSVQLVLGAPTAGGLPIGPARVVSVEGGAFASVQAQVDALSIGASTIFVVVDAANAVLELNEANNTASKTIGVQDGSFFFTNAFFSPNGDEVQDTTEFLFRLTEASASAVHAIDRHGRVAREFALESSAPAGGVTWDGRDTLGRIVPDGSYAFALIDSAGHRLASASVVVDNNNLPVGEAFGSRYLLQTNLTADSGDTSSNVSQHPRFDYQPAGWLADDSGLVSFVASQLRCVSTRANYYVFCTNYQFAASPQVGVYLTSPDGVTRTRVTPDSWARETIVPAPPGVGATAPARTGTQLIGVVPSPNGDKVLVALRNYMYYPIACGNCGGLPLYTFNWTSDLELWAVGADGSSPVRVAALPRTADRVPQSMPDVTWSPDAQLITIWDARNFGSGFQYFIDVARADGSGAPVRVAMSPPSSGTYIGNRNIFWSPDSSRLIYELGDHSLQQRIYFSVRPDGTGTAEMYREFGSWSSSLTPDNAMWLDNERFAILLNDASLNRRQLWLLSTAGAPRQLLSDPAMDVSRAAAAPFGGPVVFSDTDSTASFPNFPQQESTGLWAVDATGTVSKIYDASAQNLGISDLGVSPDGRRVVFSEQVASRLEFCFDGEGFGFCGDAFHALGVIDRRDQTVRVVQTELEVHQPPYVIGFFPDGNSLLIEDRTRPDIHPLSAVSVDDGRITALFSDPDASFSSYYSFGSDFNLTPGFTPSGKYFLYGSTRESQGTFADIWTFSSLLNLTTELRFERDRSQLIIRGTAEDRNFLSYTLEATAAATPDAWFPIAPPSDTPVINGVLAEWIPPSEGTFLVRLTAVDKAGNRSVKRRRVTWGLTPSITNVTVGPRAFSPNGDGVRDSLTIAYTVLEPVNLEFNIVNARDAVIRTITRAHPTIGSAAMAWDGRNDAGLVVADGEYRIRVLDYSFFVALDNTAPDVRLAIGSSFRTAPKKTVCVRMPTGINCTEFAGPIVDTPEHQFTGRATDASLASWILEAGIGANPSEWLTVNEGADPLLARDTQGQPIAPAQDTTIRTLADAREAVGKRFRLRAVDQAGNASVMVSAFAPQEIIVHAWDGVPVPVTRILDQSRGAHVLAVEHTLRSPQHARVQFQREGSAVWVDGPTQALAAAEFNLAWNNAALSAGQTYAVRIAGRDADGVDYFSNQFRIHADLFEMTRVEADIRTKHSRAHGVASLLDAVSNIRLVLALPGDPNIGIGTAAFSDDVTFAIGVAPNPAISSCAGERVEARFKGIGDSGRVYYTDTFQVTRFGGSGETCTSTSNGATVTLTATRIVAGCGQPNPDRVRIRIDAHGFRPGGLTLSMQDVPHGLLREVPGVVTSPFEMELDTSLLTTGEYRLQATARAPDDSNGVAPVAVAGASFIVDRAPPTAQITYPVANTEVCPARASAQAIVAIEGVAEDANFDHYEIAYGIGDVPTAWIPIFPLSTADGASSKVPHRGVLANWDVTGLPGGTYTLCLKVMDHGGNAVCQFTTFTLRGGSTLDLAAEPSVFSPNGDGNRDGVAASFMLDAPALITARVIPVVNGQRADTPVRTLLSNEQHLAGSNTVLWDGFGDLGAAAPDGLYHIVITATDACGHPVSAFVAVEIDSTPPDATISVPLAGSTGRVLVEVRGSATDSHFLGYRLEADAGATPASWSLVAAGRAPVVDGLLGQWNNGGEGGTYTLRLTATDTAGNSREVLVPITVQATQPLIVSASAQPLIFSPNGDGRADTTTIGYTLAAPARTLIEILSDESVVATLRPDSGQPAGAHTVAWNGLSAGAPFADGEYVVRLTATSPVDQGHVQVETIVVKVDTTAPTVSVEGPADGAYVRGDVPIVGTIADANIDTYAVRYGATAMGATVLLDEGTQSRVSHAFGTLSGLTAGSYTIRVTASDLAQNSTTLDRAFVIDDVSPAVTLTAPETGAIVGSAQPLIEVRGLVAEANLQRWMLRYGSGLEPAAWTTLITQGTPPASDQLAAFDTTGLADGTYTISLIAIDRAATQSEDRVQVTIDRTAPVAVIRQPADGSRLTATQPIMGDATDAHFATATLEISEGPAATAFQFAPLQVLDIAVSNGTLFDLTTLLADGVYTLRLTVEDVAGHRTAALSTIVIDTEPPSPPANLVAALENRRDARLQWNASTDPALSGYHVYRGGQRLTTTPLGAAFFVDAGLNDGTHRYTVKAVDAGGLESAASNEAGVTVDLTAPAARIQLPANNSVIGDLVDIRGTAASAVDFFEYRVSVADGADPLPAAFSLIRRSPAPVTSGLLAQIDTAGRSAGSVLTIKLEAQDLDGNVAEDRVTIAVDNQTPATPVLLTAAPAASTVTVSWQGVADADLAGYLLYNNHLLANARRIVNGSLTPFLIQGTTYVDAGLVDGEHSYYVVAVDRAGNISAPSNTVEATVETRAPRATIVQPATGSRTDSPILLVATSTDIDVASVQFQFKAVADATWTDLNAPIAGVPFTTTWDPRAVATGTYQFRAVSTDTHSNIDTAPPIINIVHADVTPPSPATALVAHVTEARVSLTWTASPSADVAGYVVNRRLGTDAATAVSGVITATTLDDVDVADGQYSYFVVAQDASGNLGGGSGEVGARVHTLFLTTPSVCLAEPALSVFGVGATPGAVVTLLADSGSGPASIATTQAGPSGAFGFAGVAIAAGLNTLTAQAEDALGNRSKPSPPLEVTFSAPPAGVTGLAALVNGRDVTLTWSAAAGASTYTVQRTDTQATTETTLTEFGVPDGRHVYTVTALNTCLVPGEPAQIEVEVGDVVAPAPPADLQATADGSDVALTWTASAATDLAGYHVYRQSPANDWLRITTLPITSAAFNDRRRPDGTHTYRVTAVDQVGNESTPSNVASATTVDTAAPEAPVLLFPTDAAHPQTVATAVTAITGVAEPASTVTLLRSGVALASAHALSEAQRQNFFLSDDPDTDPAFHAATGRVAVFVRRPGQSQSVLAVTDLSTQVTTYYGSARRGLQLAFTADGSRIVYTNDSSHLQVVDLASGNVIQTLFLIGSGEGLSLAPDATRAAVLVYDGDHTSLWIADFSTGEVTLRVDEPEGISRAVWSPAGDRIVYLRNDGQLLLLSLDAGTTQDVALADGDTIAFSPDGARIVFTASDNDAPDVRIYDVSAAAVTRLGPEAEGPLRRWAPAFSPDGRKLSYFVQPLDFATDEALRVRDLQSGAPLFEDARSDDDYFWTADHGLLFVDNEDVALLHLPGHFRFDNVFLNAGLNVISAVATDAADHTSLPADPILLTFDTGSSADLVIRTEDMLVFPAIPSPGERVRIAATARNIGPVAATSVVVAFFDVDELGNTIAIGSPQSLGTIAPNGQAAASVDWTAGAGRHRLIARVDPFSDIAEVSDTNNTAERTVDVIVPGVPSVRIAIDRTSYQPADTVRIAASAINPATAANFVLHVTIEDELGNVAATVLDHALTGFSYSTHEATPSWPTSGVLAGAYRARVTLRRADGFSVTATTPFSIAAAESLTATLSTDKSTYLVGEVAQLTGVVRNQSANVVVENLAASIRIRNAAGTELSTTETSIGTLLIGAQAQAPATWLTLAPGSYTSTITVRKGAQQVAEASRSFTVNGVVKLQGTLSPTSSRIGLGQSAEISASVVNEGSMSADGVTLRVRLVASGSQSAVRTFTRSAGFAAGGNVTWPLTLDTTGLALGTYTFFLEAERSSITEPLATATLTMLDVVAPGVQILSPAPDLVTDGDFTLLARVSDDASPVVRVDVRLDSGAWQQMAIADPAAGTYSHRFVVAPLSQGPHAVEIRATDAAGNDDSTSSSDPNPANRSFTVERTAPNLAPVASAGANQSVQEGSVVTLDGSSSADADGDPLTYQWTQTSGPAVALALTDPMRPSFVAPQVSRDGATLVFQLIVNDGTTNSAPASVSTVVTNINRAPETGDVSVTVDEDGSAALTLAATDPDLDPLTFELGAASHGTVTGTAPSLVYTPAANYNGVDTFAVVVRDSGGLAATAHISVTIAAVNDAPTAVAGGDQTVNEGQSVSLDGSASSDADLDALSYLWTQVDGTTVTLDLTDPTRPSFVAPEVTRDGATLVFQLMVNDGTVNSVASFVNVTVANTNRAPEAGDVSLTVDEDGSVGFTLVAADPDLDPLTFELGAASHGTITGVAPALIYTPALNYHGVDAFEIIVRDSGGLAATARVSVTIAPVNDPSLAVVGADQTAAEGDPVTLDGSASSDIDGDGLSYRWTQTDGPVVTLDLTDPSRPSFLAPEVTRDGGTLVFQLIVNDGIVDSAPVLTGIVVSNVNREPSTIDRAVSTDEDTAVTFTIDAVDPDDDALTFDVQPPAHGTVSGTGPEFTYTPPPDFHGVDQFTIVVRDPAGLNATARVQVDVVAVNDRPVANAGTNQTVQEMASVTLDGTASTDLDGDVLQYAWTQIAGPTVTLESADTAQPHFIAPATPAGGATLTFGLVVSDGLLESVMSQINITISNVNHPPVAEAGPPQHVGSGATVTLDGTLSYDPDNDALTYAWQQVGGVPVTLGNAQTAAPSFVAASVGASSVLTFELTVSDGAASATDRVEITVDPQNHPPIANAGPDQIVSAGASVTLSGAASSDPDGDALTYRWTQVGGVPVVVTGELTVSPTLVAPPVPPAGDTLSFDLVVSDGFLESAVDRVDVRVLGDVAGPMCAAAMVSPSVLWPPNHHFVNIAITNYGTSNNGLKLRILSVTQDEPTDGTGDGDTSPDTNFQGNVVLLRAERSGSGNGRVYRVRFSVVEDGGKTCEGVVTVSVPHDPNTPAVDDGQKFDSLTKEPKKEPKKK